MNGPIQIDRRATLLLGYGAFGRKVFERFLASAAPRGVLEWQAPDAGSGLGERKLRDLALLHVPDRLAIEPQDSSSEVGAGGVLGDLFRQIQQLEEQGSPEEDLMRAALVIAERLLSATSRAQRDEVMPLGLDVIVVAHPNAPEVLGLLDRMLTATMDALANNVNLIRAVEGAQALNFVEILDFENYWDTSSGGGRVRRAVASSLAQWQGRRTDRHPTLGRIYLVDGRTTDGIRDARHRIDEISLFLELLLFEGQRGGELQHLWQPSGGRESPLATFGVRSMERSAGLLSRLAAARFAVDWLDYLAGENSPDGEPGGGELAQGLKPYRAAELDRLLGTDELKTRLEVRLDGLEAELADLWCAHPEQPDQVLKRYEEVAREITDEIARATGERIAGLHQERLQRLREELESAVLGTLHHDRRPLPLGAVIRYLEATAAELDQELPESEAAAQVADGSSTEPIEVARQRLRELAERFDRFCRQRVQPSGLRQWWPLWSGAFAAGATPIFSRLLHEVPPPDNSDFLLVKAYDILQWLADPIALSLLLFVFFWGLGAKFFQQRIEARQRLAEAFFVDPQRGRFAARLRAELSAQGALGAPLHQEFEHAVADISLAVRGEVHREIGRALVRLRERRRELFWLRDEMRDFLTLHGLDLTDGWHQLERPDSTGIRRTVERAEDLEHMLERNPPTAERFRSTQADQRPFNGWQERYSEAFLYPLLFLDRLSRIYDPSTLEDAGELEEPGRDFLDFLVQSGSFDLAFSWKAQEGLSVDRRYCLLPSSWRSFPGVLLRLADLRLAEDHVLEGPSNARAYLLRLRTGVAPECLLEASVAEASQTARGSS